MESQDDGVFHHDEADVRDQTNCPRLILPLN